MSEAESSRGPDIQALLDIAYSLLQDGDFQGALQAYNDILATTPRNVDALAGKGRALFEEGRYDQSVRFLERAARAAPERANTWSLLGIAALADGNGEVALDAYTHLQHLGADPAENYLNLARAAYFALDQERARDYVDLSLAENPDLGLSKEWDAALKAMADRAAFLVDVGRAHGRKGRFERGLSLFLESLSVNESTAALLYAGRALMALGRPAEAVEHLARARELEETNREVLSDLATALALHGDTTAALLAYDGVLEADSDNVEALLGKAQLLVDAGDNAAAGPVVERLVQLSPHNPETWFLQARMSAHQGDRVNARFAAERAIVRDPGSPLTWLAAAELMDAIGRPGLARLCRGRAEFADTGKAPSSAVESLDIPEWTVETAEIEGAGLTDEHMAEALRNRATMYANLGQVQRSLDYLALLTERLPQFETEELARHRGSLLLRAGDTDGAREAFQKALELDPKSERARLAIARLGSLSI